MPACPSRRGTSFGTSSSSSSRANGGFDMKMKAVLLKGLKLFGENFDFVEKPGWNSDCKLLLKIYKECVGRKGFNCRFHLRNCPKFNNAEFLRTLSASESTEQR